MSRQTSWLVELISISKRTLTNKMVLRCIELHFILFGMAYSSETVDIYGYTHDVCRHNACIRPEDEDPKPELRTCGCPADGPICEVK